MEKNPEQPIDPSKLKKVEEIIAHADLYEKISPEERRVLDLFLSNILEAARAGKLDKLFIGFGTIQEISVDPGFVKVQCSQYYSLDGDGKDKEVPFIVSSQRVRTFFLDDEVIALAYRAPGMSQMVFHTNTD